MKVTNSKGVTYTGTLYLNICGFHLPRDYCPMGYNSVGYLVDEEKGSCYALTRDSGDGKTLWTYGPGEIGKIDTDGISFIGHTDSSTLPFNTTISLRCKVDVKGDPTIDYESSLTSSNNSFIIKVFHQAGCGEVNNGPFGLLASVKWIVIPVSFVLGGYLLLFGVKSIKLLFSFFGGFAGFIVGTALLGLIWKGKDGAFKSFFQFGVGCASAVLFGLIAYYSKLIAGLLTGAASGFVAVLQFYYVYGYKADKNGKTVKACNIVFPLDFHLFGQSSFHDFEHSS